MTDVKHGGQRFFCCRIHTLFLAFWLTFLIYSNESINQARVARFRNETLTFGFHGSNSQIYHHRILKILKKFYKDFNNEKGFYLSRWQ
jgi:hypothetical protein